jgi:hypothetical protein
MKKKLTPRERALQEAWDELMSKHAKPLEKGLNGRAVVLKQAAVAPVQQKPRIPSHVTPGGDTMIKKVIMYSGNNIVGIAQMAKSNAVPVFSKQEAIDVARMRGG